MRYSRIKSWLAAILSLLLIIFVTACQTTPGETIADPDETRIYTSFYTLYDFTKQLAGDEVSVYNLVPSGVDAHDWEPSTQDIVLLERADALIYNGLGMEAWVDTVVSSLENKKLLLVEAGKGLADTAEDHDDYDHDHEDHEDHDEHSHDGHDHSGQDPHVWLDPNLAYKQMEAIHAALVRLKPESEAIFDRNLAEAAEQIEALDRDFRLMVEGSTHKAFIVEHEAFHYLAKAYGLEQIAINNMHGSEPDPKQLASVIDQARSLGLDTVYYVDQEPGSLPTTVASDLGGETVRLNPYEGLSQTEIDAGETYFTVMRRNLVALEEGLN